MPENQPNLRMTCLSLRYARWSAGAGARQLSNEIVE
jgi:hypothetical protein